MKTKPLTYLLALTFLISGSTIVSAKQKFGDYKGAIYVRNYDGDTITFNLPNLHPIIGTPEIKGICDKEKHDAEQARDMVGDILKDAEKITLKNMQRGNYFRIASDVIIDGESLADILSEAGMAVRYDGGKKTHKWCDPINE